MAAFPPAGDDERLRARLVAAYLRDGQEADAIALVEKAFAADPGPETYRELRAVMPEDGWSGRRVLALEQIRAAHGYGYHGTSSDRVVLAQLQEGDLAGACWADARAGSVRQTTWLELAGASHEYDPDAAVRVYLEGAASALEHASVTSYRHAVDRLCQARDILTACGRAAELDPTVERMRDENSRRPRLIAMLDAADLR